MNSLNIQWKWILLGTAILALFVVIYFFNPTQHPIYPPCLFYKLTGLYCPGCGSTRAIHNLLRGNVSHALGLNPLLVVFIPVFMVLILFPRLTRYRFVPHICAVLLVTYAILRNIPYPPFNYLAP